MYWVMQPWQGSTWVVIGAPATWKKQRVRKWQEAMSGWGRGGKGRMSGHTGKEGGYWAEYRWGQEESIEKRNMWWEKKATSSIHKHPLITCTGPPPSSSSNWAPKMAEAPISSWEESLPCLREILVSNVSLLMVSLLFHFTFTLVSLLPHVDDVPLASSMVVVIEDDVTVSTIELSMCGGVHFHLVWSLNTPDLYINIRMMWPLVVAGYQNRAMYVNTNSCPFHLVAICSSEISYFNILPLSATLGRNPSIPPSQST